MTNFPTISLEVLSEVIGGATRTTSRNYQLQTQLQTLTTELSRTARDQNQQQNSTMMMMAAAMMMRR